MSGEVFQTELTNPKLASDEESPRVGEDGLNEGAGETGSPAASGLTSNPASKGGSAVPSANNTSQHSARNEQEVGEVDGLVVESQDEDVEVAPEKKRVRKKRSKKGASGDTHGVTDTGKTEDGDAAECVSTGDGVTNGDTGNVGVVDDDDEYYYEDEDVDYASPQNGETNAGANGATQGQKGGTAPGGSKRGRKQLSFMQEWNEIPEHVRNNPHVLKRMGFVLAPTKKQPIPRAALTAQEYRTRDQQETDPFTEQMLNNEEPEEPPTVDQLRRSSLQLRAMERDHTDRGNYVEARRAYRAYVKVSESLNKQLKYTRHKSEVDELVSKRNELIALVQSIRSDWDDDIAGHDEQTQMKLDEMRKRHEQELIDFDNTMPEDLPAEFNRYSVTYLQMRSKERNLANTKDFDSAIALQKKANKLEEEERRLNFAKMDQYFRWKRKQLRKQQRHVMETFIDYSKTRRIEKERTRDSLVKGQENRIDSLGLSIIRKCEEKGVKQSDLDLDRVDESRIAKVKAEENRSPIATRSSSAMSKKGTTPIIKAPEVKRGNRRSQSQARSHNGPLKPLPPPKKQEPVKEEVPDEPAPQELEEEPQPVNSV